MSIHQSPPSIESLIINQVSFTENKGKIYKTLKKIESKNKFGQKKNGNQVGENESA